MTSILTIFKKEMKDLLRDRRTIMAMIVLPVVLVPVVFTLVARFSLAPENMTDFKDIRVAVQANDNGDDLLDRFRRRKDLKMIEDVSPYDFKQLILDDSIDFGLILGENFDSEIREGKRGTVEIFHNTTGRDTILYARFVSTIKDFKKAVIENRLNELGTSSSILSAIDIDKTNVNPKKNLIGSFTGGVLALFFIIFCFMGAMYPAIDLFTGEKERGTIETLLVLPASRMEILIGKLLVVVTAGVISGLLTFFGIFLFLKLNADLPLISVVLSGKAVLLILLMMIPLTTFFAGVLIPVSIYAKSFKEAQSLLQPMTFFIVFPAIVAMFPGFELNTKTAMIPIFNVALASKEIVGDTIDFGLLAIVYISLLLIACVGVIFSSRWFGNESNIFRN